MKVDLRTPAGLAAICRTYRIPADVYMDRQEVQIRTRPADVDRTHFLFHLLGIPAVIKVEGTLPWYSNRFNKVKVTEYVLEETCKENRL